MSNIGDSVALADLQGSDYKFADKHEDIQSIVEPYCNDPEDVTGVVVKMDNANYAEVWVTESSRPFETQAAYVRVA